MVADKCDHKSFNRTTHDTCCDCGQIIDASIDVNWDYIFSELSSYKKQLEVAERKNDYMKSKEIEYLKEIHELKCRLGE